MNLQENFFIPPELFEENPYREYSSGAKIAFAMLITEASLTKDVSAKDILSCADLIKALGQNKIANYLKTLSDFRQ